MAVTVNISGQGPVNLNTSGSMPLVVRDTSSDYFGALELERLRLHRLGLGGYLYVYGSTGGARFFSGH